MSEDLKPCYDIDSLWEADIIHYGREIVSFTHKDYPNVIRVIDYPNKRYFFIDKERISEDRIIDINRPLKDDEKRPMWIICQSIMNAEREITLPYIPEKLTMFIELKKVGETWYLGILYYKDDSPEKNVIAVKRYFKTSDVILFAQGLWQEISQNEFIDNTKETK